MNLEEARGCEVDTVTVNSGPELPGADRGRVLAGLCFFFGYDDDLAIATTITTITIMAITQPIDTSRDYC